MIEFDLDSFRRKFQGTKAVWKYMETGGLRQSYIHEIVTDENNYAMAKVSGSLWMKVQGDERDAEFMYHPLISGVFLCDKDNHFVLAMRKHSKSFQVGFGSAFDLWGYDKKEGQISKNLQHVDILTPVPEQTYTGQAYGFLNKHFWWATDKLYYLTTLIGYIKNPDTVLVTRPEYADCVKRAWKNPCQTPVL